MVVDDMRQCITERQELSECTIRVARVCDDQQRTSYSMTPNCSNSGRLTLPLKRTLQKGCHLRCVRSMCRLASIGGFCPYRLWWRRRSCTSDGDQLLTLHPLPTQNPSSCRFGLCLLRISNSKANQGKVPKASRLKQM